MNRRRLQKTRNRPPAAQARPNSTAAKGSNWLLAAGAILSTLALLVAIATYFPFDTPTNPVAPQSITDRQAQADSLQAAPTSLPSEQQAGPGTQAAAASPARITLPTEPSQLVVEQAQPALLKAVEQAVERYPEDPQVHYIAALTYAELLQTERAKSLFQAAMELDRTRPEVCVAYADVLLQTGEQSQAVALLQDLPPAVTTAAVLIALGEAYTQLGELEQAVETLERGVTAFPDSAELHLRLAQAQNQRQAFEEAEAHARKAIDLGRSDRATYLALSTALLRLGKREEALTIREQMPPIDTEQTVADDQRYQESFRKFASHTYAQLGQVYIAHAALIGSEELLMASLALEPDSARSLAALGDIWQKSGRTRDALSVYQRLLEVQPDNLTNYSNCASLAVAVGDVGLAEATLHSAAQRDGSGFANLRFAQFLLALGKHDEAAAQAELAVERSEDIDAYLVWIAALQSQGKSAYALNALLRARQRAPNDPRLANIRL